jgi:hypothetical protein
MATPVPPWAGPPPRWAAPGSDEAPAGGRDVGWDPAPRPGAGQAAATPLRPRGISEILDAAFVTLRSSPGPTLGLALAAGAVIETLETTVAIAAQDSSTAFYVLLQVIGGGLRLLLIGVLAGVVAIVVAEASLGRRIGMADAARRIAPRIPGLVGLSLLITMLAALGLLTLGVVSAWLTVLYSFATAVYALEGGSVRHALRRSRTLVRGAWWRTFGILLLAQVVTLTLEIVVAVPGLLALSAVPALTTSAGTPSTAGYVVEALANLLVVTVVVPVQSGVLAYLYLDRRVRREALDVRLARASAQAGPLILAGAPAGPAPAIPGSTGWAR